MVSESKQVPRAHCAQRAAGLLPEVLRWGAMAYAWPMDWLCRRTEFCKTRVPCQARVS